MITKNQYELSLRQVCLFLIAFLPVTKLFMLPSILATNAKEDMWISACVNLFLDFLTLATILFACKKSNSDICTLIQSKLGKVGAKIMFSLFFVFFMLKSILPIIEQKDYVENTLYTLTPTMLYFCPFFLVALFFCTKKLRVLGRAADVLWVSTSIGLFIIFALSVSNMDFSAILPIGANNLGKILNGSYSALTWFGDAAYFLFFIGQFEFKKKSARKILLSYLIAALSVLLFMIVFYSVFTSIAFRQRFALTEISKYATVINNIGRFDYIGIMLILFSNIFALSLPVFFASKMLDNIFNIKNKWTSALITVGIQALVMLIFSDYTPSIEKFITVFCGVFFLIVGNVIPIVISLFKKKENKNAIA